MKHRIPKNWYSNKIRGILMYKLTEKEKDVVKGLQEFNDSYERHEGLGVIIGDNLGTATGKNRVTGRMLIYLTSLEKGRHIKLAYMIPPHTQKFRNYLDSLIGEKILYSDRERLLEYYHKFSNGIRNEDGDDKSADGALAFDRESGRLIGHSFAILKSDPLRTETDEGDGTRHNFLASASLYDNILALALSHEKRKITAYKHGKMVEMGL